MFNIQQNLERHLGKDESVITATRCHRVIFLAAYMQLIGAWFMYFLGPSVSSVLAVHVSLQHTLSDVFALVLLIWGILELMKAWVTYHCTYYVVTQHGLLLLSGFLVTNVTRLNFSKIETQEVIQSLSGRFLDYGLIVLAGTGGTRDFLPLVPEPLVFNQRITEQQAVYLKSQSS